MALKRMGGTAAFLNTETNKVVLSWLMQENDDPMAPWTHRVSVELEADASVIPLEDLPPA